MEGLVILYGTETGNSQDVAKQIAREAKARGMSPLVQSLQTYDVTNLPLERIVVLVVATTGQGDVPCKMRLFWRFLFKRSLPRDSLANVRVAVFGLGDSAYIKFNVVAKKLHNRLIYLGAQSLLDRGLGDDQAVEGYNAALDPWLKELWTEIGRFVELREPLVEGIGDCPFSVFSTDSALPEEPQTDLEWFKDSTRAASALHTAEEGGLRNEQAQHPSEHNPFFARVIENKRITSTDHFQDTRHIVLDTEASQFEHMPGDVLAICPLTPWESIDAFLKRIGVDPRSSVSVRVAGSNAQVLCFARSLIQGCMDVDGASPRRFFFNVLSEFATDAKERERLKYFSSPAGREEMSLYNKQSGRSVLDILNDFPSTYPPLEWLLECCPRKLPRRFSISSSHKMFPKEVHLTVAIVQYTTKGRRRKRGLCTSYLSSLDPRSADAMVPCWVERGTLSFQDTTRPLILIGPGTGVAPFRAALQERLAQLRQLPGDQREVPSYLFFGCRGRTSDQYYEEEWLELQKEGILDKSNGYITAFSRDQEAKVYVTHKIVEHADLIYRLLEETNASVFVSGSANHMPRDVYLSIKQVLMDRGHLTPTKAEGFLKNLELNGRYQAIYFMEVHGNKTTYNLENVLRQNILSSDYFKETCMNLHSFEEIVDEIYLNVKHVEPWMSGNARGASTAFCLLYRLFLLKLDSEQVQELVDHADSPYIRAVGFLYLRYVGDPKDLWSWYEPYFIDEQEFHPSPTGMPITMGTFVLDIMLSHYYFETIFPRVPKRLLDNMAGDLKNKGLRSEAKGNGGCGGVDRRGVDDSNRRPASVKASLSVAFSQRAPNRSLPAPIPLTTSATRSNVREDGRARDSFNQKLKNYERERRDKRDNPNSPRSTERGRSHDSRSRRNRSRSPMKPRAPDHRRDKSPELRTYRDRRHRDHKPRSRSKDRDSDTRDVKNVFRERPPTGPPRQILY